MDRFILNLPQNAFLAFTDGDSWRPGIGDPTFIGWLTVVAYAVAAFYCWRAARRSAFASAKVRRFWTGLFALMVALGINKQLDLQTALTFMGKSMAKSEGWYEHRRPVQAIFVLVIALGGIGFTTLLLRYYRAELKRLWQPLVGFGFLITFIVIRAASFHHVDFFLKYHIGGVTMNGFLELGGIAMIAYPAWRTAKASSDTSFVWVSGGGARGPGARAVR
jgi:hypothetical protein